MQKGAASGCEAFVAFHVAAIRPNDEKAIAYFRALPGNATHNAAGNGNEGMKTIMLLLLLQLLASGKRQHC